MYHNHMNRAFHNSNLKALSRRLRTEATAEENKLWYEFLRGLNVHFCRQKIIGNYIVDFCCPSAKLIVELDGSQHFDDEGIKFDSIRAEYLNSKGFRIVRYTNEDIHERFCEVCEDILAHL